MARVSVCVFGGCCWVFASLSLDDSFVGSDLKYSPVGRAFVFFSSPEKLFNGDFLKCHFELQRHKKTSHDWSQSCNQTRCSFSETLWFYDGCGQASSTVHKCWENLA